MGGEKPRSWTQVPAWGLEEPERLQGLVENHIHHAEKALATHSSTLAWRIPATVGCSPWVAKSQTRLSGFTFTFHFHALEKEMATHSSVHAWRIPVTVELVGCRLWSSTESDRTEAT